MLDLLYVFAMLQILLFFPCAFLLASSVVLAILGAMLWRSGSVGYVCIFLWGSGFGVHAVGFFGFVCIFLWGSGFGVLALVFAM